ncbi:prepilin peptidase [Falsiroseomonas sp. E2-1-a20]|uniref:prepilin peptidase n=1 Tax=Falsiroseomonas sp. E2-1-a20 TaxID=3239300 RepID=UPI003F30A1CE
MTALAEILVVLLLLLVAWRDVLTRTLPDLAAVAIGLLGIGLRAPLGVSPLLLSLAVTALLFLVLLALAMRGWLGGGDVKLASALALGLAPSATLDFVLATALAGGLLGLGYMAGPGLARCRVPALGGRGFRRVAAVEVRRLRRGGPLPYAVAIAAGGIFTHLAVT